VGEECSLLKIKGEFLGEHLVKRVLQEGAGRDR